MKKISILFSLFIAPLLASSQVIFTDNFSSVDTSEGPVALNGIAIPGTSPSLSWNTGVQTQVLDIGSGANAVRNKNSGDNYSTMTYPVFTADQSGLVLTDFTYSFNALYFDTLSNGGNNWSTINYRLAAPGGNADSTSLGYALRYRIRNDGNNIIEYQLFYNLGSGRVSIAGTSGSVATPNMRNSSSDLVPGAPVFLSLSVVGDAHTFSVGGVEQFSVTDDQFSSGYLNISFVNNRYVGFTDVSLVAIPEPAHYAVLFGLILGLAVIRRRRG